METKTYRPAGGLNKLPQTLREFGERQNKLNAELRRENESLQHQIEVLAEHLGELQEKLRVLEERSERIAPLEAAQELNIKRFHRCAEDLDKIERDVDRLKLSNKLNTNAIDRLTKQQDDT